MGKKRKRLTGTVEKIIKPFSRTESEKAQIGVEDPEVLYREIRVENVVADENGETGHLKEGAQVDVVIEADSEAITNKP